jgi:hypothetical protein
VESAPGPPSTTVEPRPDPGISRAVKARPSHAAQYASSAEAEAEHGPGRTPPTARRLPRSSEQPAPSASYLAARREPADELARQIRLAVDALAPAFGLDPGRVQVTVSHTPGDPHGHTTPEVITLTGGIDPTAAATRQLVVHELVHTRQHRNRSHPHGRHPDLTAAESEAAGLAAALRAGRPLWVPVQVLPDGHVAHDDGAVGTAPATAPPSAPTTPDVESLERQLDTYVAANHAGDARMIAGQLDHPWTQTSEEMIDNSLRTLSALQFVVARALVRALDPKVRHRLAQLRDAHHAAYPEACIAVLSALTGDELKNLGDDEVSSNRSAYPGAATALHGVDPSRLSAIAMRALLATLRRAGQARIGILSELEKSDRRDLFRQLFQSPPSTGTDEAELRAALDGEKTLSRTQAGGGDDVLVDQLDKVLSHPNAERAQEALTALSRIADAAKPPGTSKPADLPATGKAVTLDDLRAAVKSPTAVGTGSNAPPDTTPALVAVTARLDAKGLVDKILDELPDENRYDDTYGPTLRLVLAARAPLLNLAHATRLLSYGLFDWKIFDAEARFAYLLVRSTPVEAQDTWRQLDTGKWLHRLEDNLPDDMLASGEYTGVGSEYVAGGGKDLGVPAKLLQGYAETFIDLYTRLPIPPVARRIVRELLGLDPDGKPKPWLLDGAVAAQNDPALRIAIIRRIDARLKLDGIIAGLPDDYLFGEDGRKELLDLNQLRDPVHLEQQARSLVPSGFFGWITYTHRDAWLAAQAVRGLPPARQQRFAAENPGLWTALWGGLTAEMRRALPTTLATGRDERLPTRDAIRERLSDERLWTEANANELRAVINLAYAADDRAWVFAKSKELRADLRAKDNPLLTKIVEELKLYSEAGKRTVYVPEQTESSRAPVWGYALGVIGRAIGILIYDLLIDDSVSLDLFGKTMHLKGFDLGDVQTIVGGDLEGVTLDRSQKGANVIDVDATFEAGFIVNVDLKDLEIAGVNIVLPGKSYKSGPVSVKGLKATAGFSDRHYHDPAYIGLTLDNLALRDLVLVDPALPFSAAWAIAALALQRLAFRATQDGSGDPVSKIGQQLPKGTIPIPVFGPLFQLLGNLVALKGGIPFDETLLDLALMPLGLSFPTSSLVSATADYLAPTPAPATYLWGLASDGVLRPPYSAAQRIKDTTAMLRAFNVTFDSLNIEGISIGSGQQIRSLTLTDVNLSIGQSLPAYLNTALSTVRAAQAKLPKDSQQYKDLEARAVTLQAQITQVEATPRLAELRKKRDHDSGSLTEAEKKELAVADASAQDEGRLRELEAKDRWNPGSLSEDERKQLVDLTKRLRSDVGISAEIGSITLGPLSGSIQSAGVTLKGVHATAKLPNVGILPYAPGYLDDKSLVEQFVKGGARVPTIGELAKSSEFSLVVDSTELVNTDPKQPAVIIRADKLPRVTELQDQIAALPDIEGNRPIRERLRQALDTLVALDRARATAAAGPTDAARAVAQQRIRELTDEARRLLGTEIGGLKFGRITGELDPATGTLTATVHDTEVTGLAGPGFVVDKLTGSLELRLGAGGVTARPDQLKDTDPLKLAAQLGPSFGLRDVTATGIHLAQGSIGTAKLGHLTGSVLATDTGFEIPDLALDFLELDAIAVGVADAGITGETVRLEQVAMDVAVDLTKTSAGTKLTGAQIKSLHIGSLGGKHVVADLPNVAGGVRAELLGGELRDITATSIVFEIGSEGWAIVGGSASVGSFADFRYTLALGALKSRTTIKGALSTSKEGLKTGAPTIRASYARAPDGRKFSLSLSVAELEALGTEISTPDGSVTIRRVTVGGKYDATESGAKASATLSGLVIGPIDWKAGTGRLSGSGPITAKTITVAAFSVPDTPPHDKVPAKKGGWSVTDIVITSLEGTDLRYTDPPLNMHLGRTDTPAVAGKSPLTIGRIHIQPTRDKLQIQDLSVDFGGDLKKSLHVNGHLGIDSFSMELHRDGHLVAVVKGVSANVAVSGDYTGTVDVKGFQGATIDVGPDGITIGSDDPDDPGGLRIEQVSLTSLDITSAAGGHKFRLRTQKDGRVDLLGLRAKARIDKWKAGESHASKSPWKQVALERLYIEKVNLGAFQIDLPDDDVTIVVPARSDTDPPTLHGLDLTSPIGTDPAKLHPDFTINLETFAVEGTASVTDIALPIQAKIQNKFKGDVTLTTWTASIGFLAGGGIKIDVERPQLTMAKAAELGKDKTIRVAKFGADSLSFADGRLYVKGPYIQDLEYIQKIDGKQAVWLKVKAADLKEVNYDTRAGGSLFIPTLDIADAYVSLNLAVLTAKDPKAVDTPSTFDKTKLRPMVDELDGSVSVVIFLSADVKGLKDFRIGSDDDPLVVPIKHGAVDIPTMESNIKGKVKAWQIGSGWYLRPWVVNAVAKDPILRLDGPQLQLGIYYLDPAGVDKGNDPDNKNRPDTLLWKKILAWDLHGPDLDKAGVDKFALWAAIFDLHHDSPDPDPKKAAQDDKDTQAILDSLEIRKLTADLSIKNRGPLPITIRTDSVRGTVTLSDNALMNLHVSGGIPAVSPPGARPGSNPGALDVSLDALKLDKVDLTIYDIDPAAAKPGDPPKITGIHQLHTGQIKINNLVDATITFNDLFHALRFSGTIKSAHAENISWYKN